MAVIKSKLGLLKRFNATPQEVRDYFTHLPKLVADFPLDVVLSYVFSQVELAQNMTLYCGVVKLHKAESNSRAIRNRRAPHDASGLPRQILGGLRKVDP